jgi:hypothetical protein
MCARGMFRKSVWEVGRWLFPDEGQVRGTAVATRGIPGAGRMEFRRYRYRKKRGRPLLGRRSLFWGEA